MVEAEKTHMTDIKAWHDDDTLSTGPEGHAAHGDGRQFRDCPYIRGEDRWAWEQGWIAAEVEQRQRIATMP